MDSAYRLDTIIEVDQSLCIGCGNCVRTCPGGLISNDKIPVPTANSWDLCIDCGHCVSVCPTGALRQRAMGPEDGTPLYQSRRDRKKVEVLFAHMKRILRVDRLRLRGRSGARDESLLTAIAQNLRRMAIAFRPRLPQTVPVPT